MVIKNISRNIKIALLSLALMMLAPAGAAAQSRIGEGLHFDQLWGMHGLVGATKDGGFSMDFGINVSRVWVGLMMSFPDNGIDAKDLSNHNVRGLASSAATQVKHLDVYRGSANCMLGFFLNENNVLGGILGEAQYCDYLEVNDPNTHLTSDKRYCYATNTYDYFNYGLFYTRQLVPGNRSLRAYATLLWTKADGFGGMIGVGYAVR